MDRAEVRQRLSEYMTRQGLKSTQQRAAILSAFLDATGHVSLDELLAMVHENRPGVGYATVYRTMKLFVEAGVAEERHFGDGQTRFEVADFGDDHHDHIICTVCGHIFEFEDEEIERRQHEVAARYGLRITSHRLDIWGECSDPEQCSVRVTEQRQAQR